jgi:tetratricopeptide (TPR) repeat protein
MIQDGDVPSAIQTYSDYVDAIVSGNTKERRHKWAPANAAWRVVGLEESLGDLKAAAAAAGKLIVSFPDSRYVPMAYMAKANDEYWSGDAGAAQETLGNFRSVINNKSLSDRWGIECDLALILTNDELVGQKRRDSLSDLADSAGSKFKTVKNRALVAMGESALADIVAKRGSAKALLAEALDDFESVIVDPLADEITLAGAYAGKGDCLYQMAAGTADKAQLKQALKSFLRVAAVYREQTRYVPKCLFYAGRCFDLMGDEESSARAQQLYGEVWFLYRDSPWAKEAKNFSRR